MKKCPKCGEQKPLSEFHKDKYSKDGTTRKCGKCSTNQSKEWYRKNPHVKRNANLLRDYGISLETFENMKAKQHGKCAICQNNFKDSIDTCVDHNHITGQVRELLCNHCNRAIGLFKENIETLKSAVTYLKKYIL
jgi:adenine-specific DNA methylase